MNAAGGLSFDVIVGTYDFEKSMAYMERRVMGFTKYADKEVSSLDATFTRLGKTAAGGIAAIQLSQLPGQIVKVRAEFQSLEIALNTMLGSKAKADALLSEIVSTAAETPFGLKDLSAATKQLLAYGSTSENVISEIKMLGDVASGVSIPIGDLVYLYGTLRSQGRAYAVDIRQFAGRGIPIYAELAKVLGVNKDKVNELVEAGKVGFPEVEKAFKNMTTGGGMFAGLLEKQSQSLNGLLERLKDGIDVAFNDIGKANQGLAEDVIKGTTSLVENYKEVAQVLTILAGTYGSYRAAIALVNVMKTTEATSYAAVTSAINLQSGATERGIALETRRAQATAIRKAAMAEEAFALSLNAAAQVQSLRAEVAVAAAKRTTAVETAKSAATDIVAARTRLAAAQAESARTAAFLSNSVREAAAKELSVAQNALIISSEKGVEARKVASAAISDHVAKKTALETAAKQANALASATNATAEAAGVAAKNASSVASTRLTSLQALQMAVTRQATAVQTAFNASLLSNPIVLATVAVVALAGAIWYLSDGTTAAEAAQKSFNGILEKQKKHKEDLIARTAELTGTIQSETSTNFAQLQAYQSLQAMYPALLGNLTLQEFKLLKVADAQKQLNEQMDQIGFNSKNTEYEAAQKKVSDLTTELKNLKELQAKTGEIIPLDITLKDLEKAKIELNKLAEDVKKVEQLTWEANTAPEDQVKHWQAILNKVKEQQKALEGAVTKGRKLGTEGNNVKAIFDQINLNSLGQQVDWITGKMVGLKKIIDNGAPEIKNKSFYETQRDDKTKALNALEDTKKGSAEWNKLAGEIADANKHIDNYSLKVKKVAEKDKVQPFGSLKYWEKISRDAQEALDTLNPKKTTEIARQQAIKMNAELKAGQARLSQTPYGSIEYWEQLSKNAQDILKSSRGLSETEIKNQKYTIAEADFNAEEARKELAIKTFDEELSEKRAKYELFEKWKTVYNEDAAKEQFSALRKQGESYAAYLEAEIKKLEDQKGVDGVGLIGPEEVKLVKMKFELADITGSETPLDKFQKKLEEIRETSGSLTEEIERLQRVQKQLGTTNGSPASSQMRQQTAERIAVAEKARQSLLRDFLVNTEESEQSGLVIEKKYSDMRLALEQQAIEERTEVNLKALDLINKKEAEDHAERKRRVYEASVEYKALLMAVEDAASSKGLFAGVKAQKDVVANVFNAEGYSPEYFAQLKKLRSEEAETMQAIANMAGTIGSALEKTGGALGDIGGALSGIASQANGLVVAFDKNAKASEKWGSAVQAAASLINIVVSSAQQRKQAELEYYNAVIGQQQQYNILLNEQIGLRSEANSSIFATDFSGTLTDGFAKSEDALEKFEESVKKLETGLAKTGKKNSVSWQAIGAGAASGATIGAIAGAGVFSWATTIIGAVGGAIVGLIGGLKKKDTFAGLFETWPELIDETKTGVDQLNVALAQTLVDNNLIDDATKMNLQSTITWIEQYKEAQEQIEGVISSLAGALGDTLRDGLVNAFVEGTDAAVAFGDSVEKILESLLQQMIFSKVMGPALKKLEDEMTKSSDVASGGDGNWIDDFGRFFANADQLGKDFNKTMEEAQKEAKGFGFDLWEKEQGAGKSGLSGTISGASQESISILNGQMNAMRISNADIAFSMRQSLLHLSNISNNSNYLKRLEGMENLLIDVNRNLSKGFRL